MQEILQLECNMPRYTHKTHDVIIKDQEVFDQPADIQLVLDGRRQCALGLRNLSHDQDCRLDHYMGLLCEDAHSLHKLHAKKALAYCSQYAETSMDQASTINSTVGLLLWQHDRHKETVCLQYVGNAIMLLGNMSGMTPEHQAVHKTRTQDITSHHVIQSTAHLAVGWYLVDVCNEVHHERGGRFLKNFFWGPLLLYATPAACADKEPFAQGGT